MRTPTALLVALAASAPAAASAQAEVAFVSRTGGERVAPSPVGARDCAREQWTFRARSGVATNDAPELYLSREAACATALADPGCVRLTGVTPSREAACASGSCWTFSVPVARLVDPVSGSCAVRDTGGTRVFARFGTLLVASPRVAWDTVAPTPPTSVSASRGGESVVVVSWTYPTVSDASVDASVDASDDADVADASDASDAADVADVSDVADAADAGATPQAEAVGRFWVLCDPVADVDAGCAAGFAGLDPDDTASLARFAARCGLGDAGVSGASSTVSLGGLAVGQAYRFAVVAEDLAGNRSVAARSECSSAERYEDFWERYRTAGGEARPECAARPGGASRSAWGAAALGALAVALGALRRRARARE